MPKVKILLIEPDISLAGMFETKFHLEGYELLFALDEAQGLEIAKTERPDLVILDVRKPDETGLEFLEALSKEQKFKKTPVFLLYRLPPNQMKQAQKLGVKESFEKTKFTPGQVVKKIKQHLKP